MIKFKWIRIWKYLTEWNWRVYPPWNMTRDWWEGR
jgi:hypothetical protein